jgi:uncharacterized lipoprotein YbaY
MLLPPGSLITVELVDMSDTAGEPIASDVITGASVPPVPFALSIVLAESDQRLLGAQANIRSHRGTLLWATESPTARIRGRAAGTARATGRLSTATPGASI